MNKIEKLTIRGWGVVEAIAAIIPAINELIDAHNEMVEEKELIKNIVTCREKLAEVDKKYNNL